MRAVPQCRGAVHAEPLETLGGVFMTQQTKKDPLSISLGINLESWLILNLCRWIIWLIIMQRIRVHKYKNNTYNDRHIYHVVV